MKDFILGLKLLKYGYKLKLNIIMLLFFILIGVAIEVVTHGTVATGGFYFMITGMFIYQLIMSVDVSEYVQSTAFKRKLQVTIPSVVSTIVYLIIFTGLIIERIFLLKAYPDDRDLVIFMLAYIVVLLFCTFIFSSICYKYFVVGLIIFLLLAMCLSIVMSVVMVWNGGAGLHAVASFGLAPIAIGGYIIICLGGLLEYGIGSLLYKKPLSEFAFRGIFK